MSLREDIGIVLNTYSAESGSNTPDFILAQYLMDCLTAFDKAVVSRESWYGRKRDSEEVEKPTVIGSAFFGG